MFLRLMEPPDIRCVYNNVFDPPQMNRPVHYAGARNTIRNAVLRVKLLMELRVIKFRAGSFRAGSFQVPELGRDARL